MYVYVIQDNYGNVFCNLVVMDFEKILKIYIECRQHLV